MYKNNSNIGGKLIPFKSSYINDFTVSCLTPIYYYLEITNKYGTITSLPAKLLLIITTNIKVKTKINKKEGIVLKGETMTKNPIKYLISKNPSHGKVCFFISNEVIYTPNLNYMGCDEFNYFIEDSQGNKSNISTIYIKIKN